MSEAKHCGDTACRRPESEHDVDGRHGASWQGKCVLGCGRFVPNAGDTCSDCTTYVRTTEPMTAVLTTIATLRSEVEALRSRARRFSHREIRWKEGGHEHTSTILGHAWKQARALRTEEGVTDVRVFRIYRKAKALERTCGLSEADTATARQAARTLRAVGAIDVCEQYDREVPTGSVSGDSYPDGWLRTAYAAFRDGGGR